ncbi:hypothetical protein ACE6H2_026111 [Prunus campanulata]
MTFKTIFVTIVCLLVAAVAVTKAEPNIDEDDGSQMNFDSCSTRETTYPCSIFDDRHPSTVSMTVLVVVEMLNAFRSCAEVRKMIGITFDILAEHSVR